MTLLSCHHGPELWCVMCKPDKPFHSAQYGQETAKTFEGSLSQSLAQGRLRPPMPVQKPVADLYFYPLRPGLPVLRVRRQTFGDYLFQLLDANMDIQAETSHVGLADALQQVVLRMRLDGPPEYQVEAL